MKMITSIALATLLVLMASCAAPPPPQPTLYKADGDALVIDSLDADTYQIVLATSSVKHPIGDLLTVAGKYFSHQKAVIILENYTEPQPGDQFRDRSTPLFIPLRQAGFQHIIFLQGNGVTNPDGLIMIAQYD